MNPNSNQTQQKRQICVVLSEDVIETLRKLKEELRESGYKRAREGTAAEMIIRYVVENNLTESMLAWARGKLTGP